MIKRFGVFGYGPPRGAAFAAPTQPPALGPSLCLPRNRARGVDRPAPRVHYGRVRSLPSRRGR